MHGNRKSSYLIVIGVLFFFNCAVSLLFLIFIILQFILKGDNIGNLFQFTCRNTRFVKLGNLIERRNIIIF